MGNPPPAGREELLESNIGNSSFLCVGRKMCAGVTGFGRSSLSIRELSAEKAKREVTEKADGEDNMGPKKDRKQGKGENETTN